MLNVDQGLSIKIANMSFVCSILVVLIHVPSPKWISGWLNDGICTIAVPYFFTVSGFFLVRGSGSYREKVGRRMKTLVLPYLLWCLVGAVYLSLLAIAANIHAGRPVCSGLQVNRLSYWLGVFGVNPFEEPAHSFLWYVRALFLFVLSSPVWHFFVRRLGWWIVVCFWVLSFSFGMGLFASDEGGIFWQRTFPLIGGTYFLLGMLIAERDHIPKGCRGVRLAALSIGIVMLTIMTYRSCAGLTLSLAWRVVLIPCVIGWIWQMVPERRMPMASWSFPVYIIHWFFAVLIWWYVPGALRESCALYPVRIIIVLGLSFSVVWGFKRYFPGLSKVIFGGRL